jgi:hypothetical protein
MQSSKFLRVFKGLLTSNWALGFPRYTTGFQSHTLWFSLFLVVARRSSNDLISSYCDASRLRVESLLHERVDIHA